jgi:hypothetical protein
VKSYRRALVEFCAFASAFLMVAAIVANLVPLN